MLILIFILSQVRNAAAGFLSVGINRGDRLGIWGPNSYDWVVTQLGASMIGAILVNINPGYRSAELNYCLNKVGMYVYLFTDLILKSIRPEIEYLNVSANIQCLLWRLRLF